MDKFVKKLIERLKENTVMMANSKEFWSNPQNGKYVSEVIPKNKAIEIVNQLAEEYNNGWIPCEKELPKESGYYMACVYNSELDDYDFRKTWFAHEDEYDMDESEWRELCLFESVTAWRELPAPYQPKGE